MFGIEPKRLFKVGHYSLATIHFGLLVACLVVIFLKLPLTTYYFIELNGEQAIRVILIAVPASIHAIGFVFHFTNAWQAEHIVDICITASNRVPYSWVTALLLDGGNFLLVMLIHGTETLDLVAISLGLYWATQTILSYQEEYVNPSYDFNPAVQPHLAAIALYGLLLVFILDHSVDSFQELFASRVALVTYLCLTQIVLDMIIQRYQCFTSDKAALAESGGGVNADECDDDDDVEHVTTLETIPETVEQNGSENDVKKVATKIDLMERQLTEVRRTITFGFLHNIIGLFFQLTTTIVTLRITLGGLTVNAVLWGI